MNIAENVVLVFAVMEPVLNAIHAANVMVVIDKISILGKININPKVISTLGEGNGEMNQSRLDEKGRCCGRKPLVYKRPLSSICIRCSRAYDPSTNLQIENWAWKRVGTEFVSTKKPFGSVKIGDL